ncbi:hypothetical protein PTSG_11001 [Salpingoeca rosetta]|uniref:Tubulin-tyrosine ligase n=1 Tax=Salpingoeca rosetta (strain ATCC 50818 / BSB-021) TaxID=946362 RepID=F2USE9_SALR5|nr:uncharacterized protein PTSG_11001 [Salpingoeca rosetta]EGD81058.1 hypothetical protein PTSG_11001 [Salpingoeca rosetta]|eukprot:XP_004987927.1 hypothetical protein PTSG_11001 [Salpingoeca rosetta]
MLTALVVVVVVVVGVGVTQAAADTNSVVAEHVRHIIAESTPAHNRLLLVDTSINPQSPSASSKQSQQLYYLDRDGPAWRRAYGLRNYSVAEEHAGMSVSERHRGTTGWSHLFCLGLRRQDSTCLSPMSHVRMTEQQHINQISGMRNILWKKDALCQTIKEYGLSPRQLNFVFPCFSLPGELDALGAAMAEQPQQPWIIKPRARGEGRGIFIADSIGDVEASSKRKFLTEGAIAQPLLTNPLLINGYKFDLRLYVLVTSISPLTCYLFHEGLVRLAAEKYSTDTKKSKPSQYLTNTSIGKKYKALSDLTWTLSRFKQWLDQTKLGSKRVFKRIKAAIVRLLLVSEPRFHAHFHARMAGSSCEGCFQLLGVDVILDDTCDPFIIEVNGLPSMQLTAAQGEAYTVEDDYTARKIELTDEVARMLDTHADVTAELLAFMQQNYIGLSPTLCRVQLHRLCINKHDLRLLTQWFQHRRAIHGFEELKPEEEVMFLHHSHELIQRLPPNVHTHGLVTFTTVRTTLRLRALMLAFRRWRSDDAR